MEESFGYEFDGGQGPTHLTPAGAVSQNGFIMGAAGLIQSSFGE